MYIEIARKRKEMCLCLFIYVFVCNLLTINHLSTETCDVVSLVKGCNHCLELYQMAVSEKDQNENGTEREREQVLHNA